MWHASAAVLNGSGMPVPVALWKSSVRAVVREALAELLNGVGEEPSREDSPRTAMHLRRSLTPEEIAGLDPAWLAIPAVDMG